MTSNIEKSLPPLSYFWQASKLSDIREVFSAKRKEISISSLPVKLHCTYTVLILMVGLLFVSSENYFGPRIQCIHRTPIVITAEIMQKYCWMEGLFTVRDGSSINSAYPGVVSNENAKKRVYHKYYQWVYFLLPIQCLLFYVPKHLWLSVERSRVSKMISCVKTAFKENSTSAFKAVVCEFEDTMHAGRILFRASLMCDVFCLLHVCIEFWFLNVFLGGEFYQLGWRWLHFTFSGSEDPLVKIFPRFAKCNLKQFGYTGEIEIIDALCFLPLNIVNEKLFVVLWFWLLFVSGAIFLDVLIFLIVSCTQSLRYLKEIKLS